MSPDLRLQPPIQPNTNATETSSVAYLEHLGRGGTLPTVFTGHAPPSSCPGTAVVNFLEIAPAESNPISPGGRHPTRPLTLDKDRCRRTWRTITRCAPGTATASIASTFVGGKPPRTCPRIRNFSPKTQLKNVEKRKEENHGFPMCKGMLNMEFFSISPPRPFGIFPCSSTPRATPHRTLKPSQITGSFTRSQEEANGTLPNETLGIPSTYVQSYVCFSLRRKCHTKVSEFFGTS